MGCGDDRRGAGRRGCGRLVSDYTGECYPIAPWDTSGLPPRRLHERCGQHLVQGAGYQGRQGLCAYRDDDPNRCWRCHVSRAPEDAVCPRCKAAEADSPV